MQNLLKNREMLLGLIIIGMILGFTTRAPNFANPDNLVTIFNDTSILIILALGQMVVILTKSIDLSVAANLAFTGMAVAMLDSAYPGLPLALLVLIAIGIGAALGAINGFLVWALQIPPIVVTLGTLTIYRGMSFVLSGGAWVNAHQMQPDFLGVPRLPVLGLPILSWVAIAVILLIGFILARTAFGRSTYAAGGNPVAAIYAGIDVGRARFPGLRALGRAGRPLRLPLGLALCGRLCRYRRRLRARQCRSLRHRRHLDCRWHRHRNRHGLGRPLPRGHQECAPRHRHFALRPDGDLGHRHRARRRLQRPRRSQEGPHHLA